MIEREGEFEFDFTAAAMVTRLDDKTKQRPEGMKLVDFVVEETNRLVMLEIKDPSCKAKGGSAAAQIAQAKSRADFVRDVQNDRLITDELTPKARDSYSYLHLMKRDNKPILYVFLLGAKEIALADGLLLEFKDRLLARLRKEADQPWMRRYVTDCLVLTESTWNQVLPQYPLTRIP